jgi:hypothetical protein
MEILIRIIGILFFGLILIAPILNFLFLKKLTVRWINFYSILMSLFTHGVLILLLAVWFHESDIVLMKYYGFSFDTGYLNVLPENKERVEVLEMGVFGIGWPIKGIFGYIGTLPYPIILCSIIAIKTLKQRKKKIIIIALSTLLLIAICIPFFQWQLISLIARILDVLQ